MPLEMDTQGGSIGGGIVASSYIFNAPAQLSSSVSTANTMNVGSHGTAGAVLHSYHFKRLVSVSSNVLLSFKLVCLFN